MSTFLYCLKQGVINICRNIWSSLASVATISACIFFFLVFFFMLNDDIFGQIQFEIMWQKKDNYFLYGKEFEITLFIQGEKDEAPTNIQKEAYISFINKKMILMSEIEEKVFEYYQTVCAEYREMYGEEADLYAPIVDEPSQLVGFVKPQSIMIPRSKDKRIINVLFKTKWDLEMGIGIQLVNERIEIVGVQSDVL